MYRGDIAPKDAFERLQKNPSAVLIDVRSQPEWTFVGVPQVDRLMRVSWQVYPQMDVNANFASEVKAMGLGPTDTNRGERVGPTPLRLIW
jgi:rhodanese-related sulfurtransferase